MSSIQDRIDEANLATAVEAQEMNLVRLFGLCPYPDGNMWCVLLGGDLQTGVAGFGKTPYLAVLDFNKAFSTRELPTGGLRGVV